MKLFSAQNLHFFRKVFHLTTIVHSLFSIIHVVSLCLVLVCDCVWIRLDHENTGGEPGLESVSSKEVCPGPAERDQRRETSEPHSVVE